MSGAQDRPPDVTTGCVLAASLRSPSPADPHGQRAPAALLFPESEGPWLLRAAGNPVFGPACLSHADLVCLSSNRFLSGVGRSLRFVLGLCGRLCQPRLVSLPGSCPASPLGLFSTATPPPGDACQCHWESFLPPRPRDCVYLLPLLPPWRLFYLNRAVGMGALGGRSRGRAAFPRHHGHERDAQR